LSPEDEQRLKLLLRAFDNIVERLAAANERS
jgi:hypothetical protein